MKYFAEIFENKVINVIVSEQDIPGLVEYSVDGSFRSNPAVIGGEYDAANDVFILPKPYPSWTLNTSTFKWESPLGEAPTDGVYRWDEESSSWIQLS